MKNKKASGIAAIIVVAVIVISGLLTTKYPKLMKMFSVSKDDVNPTVHFIDVGQGDCSLICSDGHNVLIDAGPKDAKDDVVEYLLKNNITAFDYVIITHPHADHIGGMSKVLKEFKVKNLIMPDIPKELVPTSKSFEKLLNTIKENNIKVLKAVPGDRYDIGEDYFEILAPNKDYEDLNNESVVTRFNLNKHHFLFMGDAQTESEKDILNKFQDVSAEVIKVGHHGSRTSTSNDFLGACNPQTAVIMCGDDNSYNHPHKQTVKKLENKGITVFRTDEDGTIVMRAGTKITVTRGKFNEIFN